MKFRWLLALAAALLSALAHADTEWLQLPPPHAVRRLAVLVAGRHGTPPGGGGPAWLRRPLSQGRAHVRHALRQLHGPPARHGLPRAAARQLRLAQAGLAVRGAQCRPQRLRGRPAARCAGSPGLAARPARRRPRAHRLAGLEQWRQHGADGDGLTLVASSPPPLAAVALFYPGCSASRGASPRTWARC